MVAQSASILLVSDDPEVVTFLPGFLENHGYLVRQSPDVLLALAEAGRDPPDLILLDVVKDTDGRYTLCDQMKAERRTASVPVMICIERNETLDSAQVFASGAVDYLAKPFVVDEVLARVATQIKLQRAQQQAMTHSTHLPDVTAGTDRVEEALRQSEARYRALVHHFPNGAVFLFDQDLRFLIADGTGLADAGLSAEHLEGKTLGESLPAEIVARLEPYYRAILAGQAPAHTEGDLGGRIYSFEAVPLRNQRGTIVAGMLITQDVTEQRRHTEAILEMNLALEARVAERTTALTTSLRALEESQRFSEQLAAASPALLVLYDLPSWQIVYANRNPATVLGYPPGQDLQLSSATLCEIVHPDDVPDMTKLFAMSALADQDVVEHEMRVRHVGGEWHWFILRASVFARSEEGHVRQLLITALDVTARRKIEEEIRAYHNQLVRVQDAERAHIARELHDQVGQILTALNLTLGAIPDADPATVSGRIRDAQAQVRDLTAQVRQLSLNLRPVMLDDLGLLAAVLWHAERFSEQTGLHVDVQHDDLAFPISPEVAMTAYRVVQEALTNVARHAGVDRATLQLWIVGQTLYAQVTDAGHGFDVERALAQPVSSGLFGMRERVRLVGGTLSIESGPDGGTQVMAELPLGHNEPARTSYDVAMTLERSTDANAAIGG